MAAKNMRIVWAWQECLRASKKQKHYGLPNQMANKHLSSTATSTSLVPVNEHEPDNSLYFREINSLTRPNFLDPRGTTVFMFPGQGSQTVGMVDSLLRYPKAVGLLKTAEEVLNENLLKIITKGPQEKLNQTVLSQVALFVTSLAYIEKLRIEQPMAVENCVGAIGFSVGEIAALVFAGCLSFEDGLMLAHSLGECMQLASKQEDGGMLTVIFKPGALMNQCRVKALEHCVDVLKLENPVCSVAIHLFANCQVIAGNIEALQFIEKKASHFGIKHTKRLAVSGAFHSQLMYYTSLKWTKCIERVTFKDPLIPVYSCVNSKILDTQLMIYENLRRLLYSPVKWLQLLSILYKNPPTKPFPRPYICEPAHVLKTTLKNTNPQAAATISCLDPA